MQKLAIIGASYLQLPLIEKAKEMGLETHVFAWQCGDVGESAADYFYPISITEVEEIYKKCKEIQIDGICTIASDLAVIPVNYVSEKLGLTGNPVKSTLPCTNKAEMRKRFKSCGDPSPDSYCVKSFEDCKNLSLRYPVIVKPLDRSGSRGITKVESLQGLKIAIEKAKEQGFVNKAVVEEFIDGEEYSVEYISFNGNHKFLALTKKFTTGAPNFIEKAHMQPADVDSSMLENVKKIIEHALNSLEIKFGASHSEIKIDKDGKIGIIEIGARMGGDFIGSNLVKLSTGYDFIEGVINVALGIKPKIIISNEGYASSVFIFSKKHLEIFKHIKKDNPSLIVYENIDKIKDVKVVDSASRFGSYILFSKNRDDILNCINLICNEK